MATFEESIEVFIKAKVKLLSLPQVDLYQINWPFPPMPIMTWIGAMSVTVADGLIQAAGITNYS